MRALYGNPSRPTPHTDTPSSRVRPGRIPDCRDPRPGTPRGDTERSHDTGNGPRDSGKHPEWRDHTSDQKRDDAASDRHSDRPSASDGDDKTAVADLIDKDEIDPRWLVGIPRRADALPDDTGRAYLRWPWQRQHDQTRHAPDRPERAEPLREKDTADRLHPYVDRPAFQDRFDDREPPDRYGQPLERLDDTRVPCLKGRPERNQTEQGWLGDCGVIATLGAIAAHRPDDIAGRIRQQPDGTYKVSLNEAQWTDSGAAPTGQTIEMTVTPDLPVFDTSSDEPAFAQASDAAWIPVLEKAAAGLDQTWTPQRQSDWADVWQCLCEADASDAKVKKPRSGPPPDGYVRLNQGSGSWDRAELLTQFTGRDSAVRPYPDDPKQLTAVLDRQLREGKPVLAASRARESEKEKLPYELEPSHAYEVVAVSDEKIHLRNPWNRANPGAIKAADFTANMQPNYATLK